MSRTVTITSEPVARFSGPPADRMAGRAQARAARASAAKPKGNYTPKKPQISAATAARVEQFLDSEEVLDQAIHQGVIGANMRGHYRTLLQADPSGTRDYLQKLGMRPQTSAPMQAAASSDEYPTAGLSRAEQARIAAAREGRQPRRIISGGL